MRNKLLYIRFWLTGLIVLFALIGTGCVKDDFRVTTDMEGYPVTVSLNLGMGEASDIVVSRADNSNSDLINLVLFVYGRDGRFQQMLSTTASEQDNRISIGSSSATEDGVKYPITIKTTSGTKNLLAVANTSSVASEGGFWESMASIARDAQDGTLNFEGLKAAVIELREDLYKDSEMLPIQITASSQMLISGSNEGVVFNTSGDVTDYGLLDGTDNVVLKMDRAMARITFNIAEKPDGAKGTFTPSSFKVYNIPVESSLTNAAKSETSSETTYINSASMNIGNISGGKYSFTFYMPENIQKVKQGATIKSYNDRDTWTGDRGSLPENKIWTNAPQNSTFVVVSGTYSQTAADEAGNNYTGNVSYTIHLGDFSTGDNATGSLNNFAVERNCAYTYNMSVLSVDKIVVEAKKEGGKEYQQGAEGQIFTYDATTYSYELDAHYEQVFLEYNLTKIADAVRSAIGAYNNTQEDEKIDNAIADNMILVIQSEAMDYTHLATDADPYYSVQNKRGTLKPYKIYSDSVRGVSKVTKNDILDGAAGTDDKPTKGFDYKWIEFWPQSGTDIAAYPGVSSWSREDITGFKNRDVYGGAATAESKYLMDVYDVIVAMGNVVKKIYKGEMVSIAERNEDGIIITPNNSSYVARFTAFVNEYYYYRHPLTGDKVDMWSVMTNKIPREMIIAMSSSVSDDGNSSYSQIYSYITQLSMQTFYNARTNTSINGFGIETYNETPRLTFGTPRSTNGLNKTDGRSNQIILIGGTGDTEWNTYINPSYNGWKTSVGSDHTTHKLSSTAYKTTDYRDGAYYACMSRNRDLNGNGKIDNNEVRWYLPSLNEYIRIGIGSNAISNAAQLYIGDKAQMKRRSDDSYTNGYPIDYIWDGALFYTSSGNEERVYWAAERGSYSADGINWGGGSNPKPIRCIRALPATSGDNDISTVHVESDASFVGHNLPGQSGYNENNPIVLEFRNRLVDDLYRERTNDVLIPHNEDATANSYYDGIFVAKEDVYEYEGNWWDLTKVYQQFPLKQIINYGGNQTNPCDSYSEDGDGDAVWRVPNLAEFSAMVAAGLVTSGDACCTQFSNMNVRCGFAFSSLVYCPGDDVNNNGVVTKITIENVGSFRVRCVRDVPEGYVFPAN